MKKNKIEKSEKNLIINILLAFGIKGLSLIVSVIATPLYIKYFDNNSVLGIWYTILSVLSWILIADLGLGNGLRNKLTQALANGDYERARKFISSSYVAVSLIILPIAILGVVGIQLVDFNTLLKISESVVDKGTLRLSISILFCGVCLSFILKLIGSVIYAMQKSSINNFKTLITSIIPLVFILVFNAHNPATNLLWLSIVHVLSISIPSVVATVILFCGPLKKCRPTLKAFEKDAARSVMNLGMKFFVAQIFFMIMMSTNEFFINTFFLPDDVVEYSIYYRVFMTVGSLFMLALTPLWSKVTQDIENKRFAIVKKTNRLLYALAGAACVCEFIMVLPLQWFFDIWLQDATITVSWQTALFFAFFGSVYIFNIALTTVANGIGELKTQMVFYGVGSALKIPAILLLRTWLNHWNVIVLYNACVLFVFCIFQLFWIEKRIKKIST